MGAPVGNRNAAKGKKWSAAIERAVERHTGGRTSDMDEGRSASVMALDAVADKFVLALMTSGDLSWFKEFGDRIDGKAVATTELSGPDGEGIPVSINVRFPGA